MKLFTIISFLMSLIVYTKACDTEPEPVGGFICVNNSECNGDAKSVVRNNYCSDYVKTTGKCVCAPDYAGSDCYYERYDKNLAGGLQFLAILGIGGIGNFITELYLVGLFQLLLMLGFTIYVYTYCFSECYKRCCKKSNENDHNYTTFDHNYTTSDHDYDGTPSIIVVLWVIGFQLCIIEALMLFNGSITDGNGYYPHNSYCVLIQQAIMLINES